MADLRALVEAVREARERAKDDLAHYGAARKAEAALCDALLTSRAVEAVEAVVALGKARKAADEAERAEEAADTFVLALMEAKVATRDERNEALDKMLALADRLAAKGGE